MYFYRCVYDKSNIVDNLQQIRSSSSIFSSKRASWRARVDLKSFDDSLASVDHVLLAGLSRDELALAEQTVAAQLHLLIQILKQSIPVCLSPLCFSRLRLSFQASIAQLPPSLLYTFSEPTRQAAIS